MKRKKIELEEPISKVIEIIAARKTALSVQELAEILSMSPQTMYRWISKGRLPAFRFGMSVRLDPQTTADWLRERFF